MHTYLQRRIIIEDYYPLQYFTGNLLTMKTTLFGLVIAISVINAFVHTDYRNIGRIHKV